MNLFKKIICFLCFAVFLFSFSTKAYATNYVDDNNIQYNTAVGVLSGIGIIGGYSDNSFRPSSTVTREEAAKMITYTLLGPTSASNLKYAKSSFADVTEERWSLPYIEWCAEKGIITGRGDGTFDPTGNISSNEFAKMLLCATGYGQNKEYTGDGWDYNAARDAYLKGIFDASTGSVTGSATREQAAIYIFNTITNIERVKYSNGSYSPADGSETKDNTIAAFNFGITETSIISGMIEANSANGVDGTKINNTIYNISTGRELLGHYVTIYSNGKTGTDKKTYYFEDKSKVVTLDKQISDFESFTKIFGYTYYSGKSIAVFNKDFTYSMRIIDNFYPDKGIAPVGTYVFYCNELIAYFPKVN